MSSPDPRAAVESRIPASTLKSGDLVNTSPGGEDDWQQVVGVYARAGDAPAARQDIRTLLADLGGRYVLVELTDLAPVDSNVYFTDDGTAMLYASDEGADTPVNEAVSIEDGIRTYLYTKFELVNVRSV